MDFTMKKYEKLCRAVKNSKYKVLTVNDYLSKDHNSPFVIMRHDVDRDPKSAIKMARIEERFGINSTFYFRADTLEKEIMKEINSMGNEIGYHYECLDESEGDYKRAIKLFEKNIKLFESFNIKTICMHGNPLSKYDNRDLWKKYNFRDYGILGEAYLSVDFDELKYFSDTGRTWKMSQHVIKDRPENMDNTINIESTNQLIQYIKKGDRNLYLLLHPCRWNDNIVFWIKELLFQNIKNIGKSLL